MTHIETVIFDLEGVVIDTEKVWDNVDLVFVSRRGIIGPVHAERYRNSLKPLLMGRSLVDGAGVMKEFYGLNGNPEQFAQERREIAKELFQQSVDFIPGFADFFKKIRGRFRTCIATSLERDFIRAVDEGLKLTQLFNGHVFSIQDIGYISKPNPDIFLHAARQLNSNPDNCLVIEDSPNGVEAAIRAGMQCIALTTSTSKERLANAHLIVDRYSEIDLNSLPKEHGNFRD